MIYPEFQAIFEWFEKSMRDISARAATRKPYTPHARRPIKPDPEPIYDYEPLTTCICNAVKFPPCSFCESGGRSGDG